MPNPAKPLTVTLHRSCKTISLYAFIEAYCNNDYSQLIISGNPTALELSEAFIELIFDYGSSVKHETSGYLFTLSKQIAILQHHIFYVENACLLLRHRVEESVINELINWGYSLSLPPTDEELDLVLSLSIRQVDDLQEATDQYNRLNNTVSGKKQTEEEFNRTISALSKYIGYRINKKETMMDEFTSIFNLYLEELNHAKKQHG